MFYKYLKKYQNNNIIFNLIILVAFITGPVLYVIGSIQVIRNELGGDFTYMYKSLYKIYKDGEVK